MSDVSNIWCYAEDDGYVCTIDAGHEGDHEAWAVSEEYRVQREHGVLHTWPQATPSTSHLTPSGQSALVNLLGAHFVSHDALDVAAFERLVAEDGAVQ